MEQVPPDVDAFRPRLMHEIADHLEPGDKQDPSLAIGPMGYNLRSRSTAPTSTLNAHDEGLSHATVAQAINLFITAQTEPIAELMSVVLTQYSLKQGLKRFGDTARAAVQKEMMQLHNCKVPKPWQKEGFLRKNLPRCWSIS